MLRHLPGVILSVAVSGSLLLGVEYGHKGFRAGHSLGLASSQHARQVNPSGLRVISAQEARSKARFQLPVFFDRNVGQTDPSVLYTAHGLGYSLFLTRTGATIVLPNLQRPDRGAPSPESRSFKLSFKDANPRAEVEGLEELPGKSNYFSGSDPMSWHTQVSQYRKVRYRQLYPGVDLIFYSRGGQIEYDVVAEPGADLNAVHLQATGAKATLTEQGDATLQLASSRFDLRKPRVYQGGVDRREIPATFSLRGNDLSFSLAEYDHNRSIVIDPALVFSTYLNSNCEEVAQQNVFPCFDEVTDIAADATGSYITGRTTANTFPGTNGPPASANVSSSSAFVLKLDPAGTSILYAAYLSEGEPSAIAVDASGAAFISGVATTPSNFPLTNGVFSAAMPATPDQYNVPFAAKLSANGVLLQSTLLQQPTPDATLAQNQQLIAPARIAVDSQGALYITGLANEDYLAFPSIWMPLPVTQGAYQTTPGTLFVLKLTPTFSGLTYSTYVDGTKGRGGFVDNGPGAGFSASGIAVDSKGNAFLSGDADSTFPTTPGSYLPSSPSGGAFVMELNPDGSAPIYSTFFPGVSHGLAIDPQGQAVIVGAGTGSMLPVTTNAFCTAPPILPPPAFLPFPGFVAKLNAAGTALIYSTALCGPDSEAHAVAVDATGAAYVIGANGAPATFQPILLQPIQAYFPTIGGAPASMQVALKLDTSGNLLWSTFMGASAFAITGAGPTSRIAIDPSGATYVLDPLNGSTTFLPTTPGTVGLRDPGVSIGGSFLLKIAPSLGAPVGLAFPDSVTFPPQNVNTSSAAVDVEVGNFGDAPMSPVVSISGDFSEHDSCSTAVAPGQKCDINVVFTPKAAGARIGSLNLTLGGATGSETIPLNGTGAAPALSIAPTSLSFGAQSVGTTSPGQQVTLTNTGTGPVTIASIQTTNEFNATNTCGAPVPAGGSCTVQVTFTPTASGSQSGTLTITDDAPNSPQRVALTGNQPAATFSISSASGSSLSASVRPGQTATYTLSLAGTNGFSGTVNLSCTGAPANATCSVSPNTATINGSSAVPVTVAVSTHSASGATPSVLNFRRLPHPNLYLAGTAGLLFLLLFCYRLIGQQSPSRVRVPAFLALLLLSALGISCNSSALSSTPPSQPGTPTGQYELTVIGTSGSVTQNAQLSLTVN